MPTYKSVTSSSSTRIGTDEREKGKENLVNRFRDSHILEQAVSFRPKIFFSSGPSIGLPEPFPGPYLPSHPQTTY
jgi:hypothetical protein